MRVIILGCRLVLQSVRISFDIPARYPKYYSQPHQLPTAPNPDQGLLRITTTVFRGTSSFPTHRAFYCHPGCQFPSPRPIRHSLPSPSHFPNIVTVVFGPSTTPRAPYIQRPRRRADNPMMSLEVHFKVGGPHQPCRSSAHASTASRTTAARVPRALITCLFRRLCMPLRPAAVTARRCPS